MTVRELVSDLGLRVAAGGGGLDNEIDGGYVSDLLSDVLANGRAGNVWVTLQSHQNIVAVASMKDIACVVLVNGRDPEEETAAKADAESLPVLVSDLSAFDLVGRLFSAGIAGTGK